ncbi:MAG: Glu/Leu/Phe/Val dehydrogenase [Gammaproteobacteria bacterium]|nr:Glu/Leu/Phe/Val dehydrogenase [Gammaproteobacteria bacterium]MDH3466816.1 Glu/Leu/Phe/Val dehydrogenase [Gammaproteobacteria bacterium]
MEDQCWQLTDDIGPEKILHVYNKEVGLKAIVVVDNVSAGPSIGGVRMVADASLQECSRLARAMTLKNAAAALPHGGGKSVIFADPKSDAETKERIIRAFAIAIRDLVDYIPGPDMGTNEECMAWIKDEIGRSVGLPAEVGGIPLDEIGATGYGLVVSIKAAQNFSDIDLRGARVAVQGFGSVGQHAARFLAEEGSLLVAAADSRGTLVNPDGLNVAQLIKHAHQTGSVCGFADGLTQHRDSIIDVECDIWIPAARPDVVNMENVGRLDTKLIAEGANIPITHEAEQALAQRGVTVIPDFIANAGGVICAAVEYHNGTKTAAFAAVEEKISRNTTEMFELAASRDINPRMAANDLAQQRLQRAMSFKRWA